MNEWIKCSERLPEEKTGILVFQKEPDDMYVSWFVDGEWFDPFMRASQNVTHWMPLPEPPKE